MHSSGLVTNIQKYSLHDGPGIRTTVFLKGCPLHCAWCHNPENISRKSEIIIYEARCIRCGQCFEVCPQRKDKTPAPADSANITPARPPVDCTLCGACAEACPTGARSLLGHLMEVDQLLAEILADRVFYEESQGGVTFSGGEPLLQFEFLKAVLQACREQGLHTAVDTCGFAPWEHLHELVPLTNLFLYDLKFFDDAQHREYTGVSNRLIFDNLRALAQMHPAIWLRIPIIPGVNNSAGELQAMARLAAKLPGLQQVNVLPYHKTGVQKFRRLGQPYTLPDTAPPSSGQMETSAQIFRAQGLTVKVGG